MRKKSLAMAIVAAVAAVPFGYAAPASAQECNDAIRFPETTTVTIENGQIRINPSGPPEDVDNLTAFATVLANIAVDCAVDAVPSQVWCALNVVANGVFFGTYVYQDPYTGEIVIDYGRLVADTSSCV